MAKGLMKSIKGMAWMSSSVIIDYVVNLIITYVLARLLTQADYGEVAAITVLVGFAKIFWQMGVGPALIQKKEVSEKEFLTAQTLNFIFGILIFGIINLFATLWASVFSISSVTMLRVYSLVFLFASYNATPLAIIQRECNFKFLANINVFSNIFYGISAVFMAKMGLGPWALVYATVLRDVFKMVVLIIKVRLKFSLYFSKEVAKGLLHFGGGYTLAQVFNYIANNGDNFVVNKTLGKASLGTYNKVYALIGYPASLVGDTVHRVMFPILSGYQDDFGRIKKFFYTGTGLIAFLTVPISIICYFCSEDLVLFFLGEKWISVTTPFSTMIGALFFRTAYKICDAILKSIGKVYHQFVIQVIYSINIVLGAYIGHFYGLTAIALCVTVAFTVNYFITTTVCMYFIKANLKDYIKSLVAPVLYGGIVVVICMVVSKYIAMISNHFAVCVVWTLLVFGIYLILYVLTRKKIVIADINTTINTIVGSALKKLKK